jgi:hypothetical protein
VNGIGQTLRWKLGTGCVEKEFQGAYDEDDDGEASQEAYATKP